MKKIIYFILIAIASLWLNLMFILSFVESCVNVDWNYPFIHVTLPSAVEHLKNERDSIKKEKEALEMERSASLGRLRDIAKEIGIDAADIDDEAALKEEIVRRIQDMRNVVPE